MVGIKSNQVTLEALLTNFVEISRNTIPQQEHYGR